MAAAILVSMTIRAMAITAVRRSFSRALSSVAGITLVRRITVRGAAATGMTVRAGAVRPQVAGMAAAHTGAIMVRAGRRRKRVADIRTARRHRQAAVVRRPLPLRRQSAARRCPTQWAVDLRGRTAPRRHPRMAALATAAIHAAFLDATAVKARNVFIENGPRQIRRSAVALFYPRCECCALYNSRKVRPTGAGISRVPVHPLPNGKREIAFLSPPMRSSTRTTSLVKSAYAAGRFTR